MTKCHACGLWNTCDLQSYIITMITLEQVLKTPPGQIVTTALSPEDETVLHLSTTKDTRVTKVKWWRNAETGMGGWIRWNRSAVSHATHLELLGHYASCYTALGDIPGVSEVDYFKDELGFLSNMSAVNAYEDARLLDSKTGMGVVYLENLYQSMKFTDDAFRRHLLSISPGQAKTLGRTTPGVSLDWTQRRVPAMEHLLQQKFNIPTLKSLLLATGTLPLVEVNHWYDTYWGVCNGKGNNKLGELLMQVRRDSAVALW